MVTAKSTTKQVIWQPTGFSSIPLKVTKRNPKKGETRYERRHLYPCLSICLKIYPYVHKIPQSFNVSLNEGKQDIDRTLITASVAVYPLNLYLDKFWGFQLKYINTTKKNRKEHNQMIRRLDDEGPNIFLKRNSNLEKSIQTLLWLQLCKYLRK